jgi:SPP1 gp7 family putative phage head morphogenesis protein
MGLFKRMKGFFKNWSSNQKIVNRAKSDSKTKEEYKIDELMLLSYYRSDPVIKRGINTIINKMFSDGYRINAKEGYETEIETAKEFIKRTNYYLKLKNDIRMALIGGNGYHEVNEEVFSLNPHEITIEKDKETGEVKNYIQKIDGKIVATLEPENVIHYTIENLGDNLYGIGLIESILYASAIKRFAERNLGKRFEREKLRGFWLFKGMSDNEFDEMTKVISECKDDPQRDIYLKGGEQADVTYSDLIKGDDMQFEMLLNYLRQNQITGLMLHPINVGIPQGSNKSTAGEENKDFDEAVASMQEVIQNIVTKRLFNDTLGLENIEFELISVNKRDTLRETEIAERLNRLPTSVNEVREELGYKLIEEDWADEVRKTNNPESNPFNQEQENPFEENEEEDEEDEEQKSFTKSIQKKKTENFPRESAVKLRDEKQFYSILQNWIRKIQTDTIQIIKTEPNFKKQIEDPDILINKILSKNSPDTIRQDIDNQVAKLFNLGHNKAQLDIKKRINLNTEKLNFLKKYTFDLIKGVDEDIRNKLRQILRRGIINGEGINQISKAVKEGLEVDKNRANTIARTEVVRASNIGRMEAYKQAGVKKVKLVVALDDRTSDTCREQAGRIIDLTKGETFIDIDGAGVESPPLHPNCRSSVVFVE